MVTPEQAYDIIVGRRCIAPTSEMLEFIRLASAKDLQEFILISRDAGAEAAFNRHWLEQAKIALPLRIGEEAAQSADKLIQHTEKLTTQTDEHIKHSGKLTQQTEKLVSESVNLTKLTKVLIWLTVALWAAAVVQIVIMVFDYIKHK